MKSIIKIANYFTFFFLIWKVCVSPEREFWRVERFGDFSKRHKISPPSFVWKIFFYNFFYLRILCTAWSLSGNHRKFTDKNGVAFFLTPYSYFNALINESIYCLFPVISTNKVLRMTLTWGFLSCTLVTSKMTWGCHGRSAVSSIFGLISWVLVICLWTVLLHIVVLLYTMLVFLLHKKRKRSRAIPNELIYGADIETLFKMQM